MVYKIISLGSDCFTAAILKTYKLRKETYMFDWALSDVDNVIKILNNYTIKNCNELIEKKELINFVHHKNREQRKRAIERFFSILNDNINKLFIIVERKKNNGDDIIKLINILSKITNFSKLIHIQYERNSEHKLELVSSNINYEKYILYTPFRCPYSVHNIKGIKQYMIFENLIKKYNKNINMDKLFNIENIKKGIMDSKKAKEDLNYIGKDK